MNVKARLMLRGVTVALLVGALVPAAAGTSAGTDVEGPSEQSLEEGSTDAVATRLVLRPVCSSDELHRFAVVNESGPATRFTVEVAAPPSAALAIAAGETVRFWVDADHDGPVGISWPDGSASATAAREACTSGNELPAAEPTEQERAEQPVEPAPSTATERNGQARPEEPPPADTPSTDSAAESAPRAADPPAPAGVPAPGEPAPREAPADGTAASAAPGAQTTPRPRPSGAAFACPDHWVAVDGDGDGTIDGGDDCELVVETGADGGSTGTALTTAALIITLGLLIASVGAGAVSRRAMR
jgi:hypothetical protein